MTPGTSILFTDLARVELPDKPLHLAIGMFDGVHLGHQAVIETAVHAAQRSKGICGVLTFWPHPSRLFSPENPVTMIMSPETKAEVLASHKVMYIIQQAFDSAFASIEAEDLVKYLKDYLPKLSSIHVGSNWRFGKKRLGDISMLVRLGRESGVHVISVDRVFYDGEPVSSTRIRDLLLRGEMEMANALLGDPYFCLGTVVEGKKLGGKIGFPTLNIPWSPDLHPPYGVYCVEIEGFVDGRSVVEKGVANFGVRPTVSQSSETVLEVHLLENCPFTAGQTLKVQWFHFIRSETKFENLEALKRQIAEDVKTAKDFFKL